MTFCSALLACVVLSLGLLLPLLFVPSTVEQPFEITGEPARGGRANRHDLGQSQQPARVGTNANHE
jgi:hypothetical protein